jgi:hypothetical protein
VRARRALLVGAILTVASLLASGVAVADVNNSSATNLQDGSNRGTTTQGGTGKSGDAVGGQVSGVVSSGRASVDARNTSSNSDVTSGDVNGSNTSASFTGQNTSTCTATVIAVCEAGPTVGGADVTASAATNLQDGNNRFTNTQTANLTTGDGVGGEVIGVVTAAGGTASIVAANRSDNVDVTTGDADGSNDSAAFTGQDFSACIAAVVAECSAGPDLTADITGSTSLGNLQEGDNRTTSRQALNATTGDGVAGQVIGAVSGGATSIDANNTSTDSSVDTGDASADNSSASFTGQNAATCVAAVVAACEAGVVLNADIVGSTATANLQEGSNRSTSNQTAAAASGDGVAGEVIGAVTSAGGSNSIVAANRSDSVDVTTGDADASNSAAPFVGQNGSLCVATVVAACASGLDLSADITGSAALGNLQEGNNRLSASQSASANTGDGVAGQVVGSVAAGATSIDARNSSTDVSVDTGDADAHNSLEPVVGQNAATCTAVVVAECTAGSGGLQSLTSDIASSSAVGNLQDGNDSANLRQAANATSGDGVGGQVIGGVTSAGGSASIVAANVSDNVDITTGDATADNSLHSFVGQNFAACLAIVVATCTASTPGGADISSSSAANIQDGSNRLSGGQTAAAATGDGVAGQVIGAVSAGAASVDASNRSTDSSVETGDSNATNDATMFVGQNTTACTAIVVAACDATGPLLGASDVTGSFGVNVQDGNNSKTFSQNASASSGDGVAGQVTGVVTSAGGSASVVVANTSSGIDATSGESRFDNSDSDFVGQNASGLDFIDLLF